MTTKHSGLDSRTSSILINLDLNLNKSFVSNRYSASIEGIEESIKEDNTKVYRNLRSALKESYLTSSLKYGNGFIS